MDILDKIIKQVLIEIEKEKEGLVDKEQTLPLEISARHCHLSKEDIIALFGKNSELEAIRELSQLGQFLSKQRIRIIGKKGVIDNVAVLGPSRNESQIEISATDARFLGVKADLRLSGDTKNSPGIMVSSGDNFLKLDEGVIVAKNHIHMNPSEAARFGVEDKSRVDVLTKTKRPVIFKDVLVRVDKSFVLNMHIDFDEANACVCEVGDVAIIINKNKQVI